MHLPGKARHPSQQGASSVGHRSPSVIRNTLLVLAVGLFGTAAALAVVQPGTGSDLPQLYQARQVLPLPDAFFQEDASPAEQAPFVQTTRIQRGDTLAALLQRLNVSEDGLLNFLTHDQSARSIYKLYPGRDLMAGLDASGRLAWLRYHHTPSATEQNTVLAKWLEIRPDGKGGFTAQEQDQQAVAQTVVAEGNIVNSLFGATDAAGIPDSITVQMTDILGSKIDFLRDLRRGDTFRIIYETYSHDGRPVGAGRILALEFSNGDKQHSALWFSPEANRGSYYDFDGNSLRGTFLRAPLKFSRISSNFGTRKHPILGYTAQHKGTDYAAPTGTPIHTTADGVVSFQGWQRGYGNVTIISHHSGYSTLYAHQSRFVGGLKKGDTVAQGQQIGYVGSTGRSTGPHLHYEVRKDNVHLNPQSVDLPIAQALDGKQRLAFQSLSTQYQQHFLLLAAGTGTEDGSTEQVATLAQVGNTSKGG